MTGFRLLRTLLLTVALLWLAGTRMAPSAPAPRDAALPNLLRQARVFRLAGAGDRAAALLRRGLRVLRRAPDSRAQAAFLNELGLVEYGRGRYQAAFDALVHASACARAGADPGQQGRVLNDLGAAFQAFGCYDRSESCFRRARRLAAGRDPRLEAQALSNQATDFFDLAEYPRAADGYRQALAVFQSRGDARDAAAALKNLGYTHFYEKDYPRATSELNDARAQYHVLRDPSGEALALENLAWVRHAQSRDAEAWRLQRQALALTRNGEDAGLGHLELGRLALGAGRTGEAVAQMSAGYATLHVLKARASEAKACAGLMDAWAARRRPRLAIFWGKLAVGDYQELRGHARPLGAPAEADYVRSHADTYRRLADLLIGQGRLPEAQQTLALLKRDELDEFERAGRILVRGPRILVRGGPGPLRGARILVRAGGLPDETGATPTEARWAARLRAARDAGVIGNVLARLPDAFAPPAAPPSHLSMAWRTPGPGVAGLATLVAPERYHVILTTARGRVSVTQPVPASRLNALVFQFRAALQTQSPDSLRLARRLYGIVVGPTITAELERSRTTTLLWSLDGALRYLPPAALNDGHRYLAERWRSVVWDPTAPGVPPAHGVARRALGLGVSRGHVCRDPATGSQIVFDPLPGVPQELHALVRDGRPDSGGLLPGRLLMDGGFTAATLQNALAQRYPVVHIAGHFRLQPGDDTRSALLLGDGALLTLAQVEDLPHPFAGVDLLTLSACETAAGAGSDGRELDGFAAIARRGGARSVLASLWPVSDAGTQALMQTFYRQYLRPGVPPAEALRQAQLALLRGGQFAHPYYWASFVLLGNEN